MTRRADFARQLIGKNLRHAERAVAFLWFYRQNQEFEDRTAAELSLDMSEEGFPAAHVSRLRKALLRSRFAVRGRRSGSFRINPNHLRELGQRFASMTASAEPNIGSYVIPAEWVLGTRVYLEQLVDEINGCYQFGFYDGCAALARRLMESIIIEIYIADGRASAIKNGATFFRLSDLITHVCKDPAVQLARASPRTMKDIRLIGDTAAHDRAYITPRLDIDDNRLAFRRLVADLLALAGIRPVHP
jgi:hypothetical protein